MLVLPTFLLLALLPLIFCAEDLYRLLGIDKSASERDIKKAYRTLSKKYHPDKNPGDDSAKQKFVSIADAYEALSDPTSRRIYDQYGHDGLAQHRQEASGGRAQHNPFDLFSRFFGGSGHFGQRGSGVRRGPDMEVHVSVPLRDFYTGHSHEFTVEKQQVCDECEGSGSADGVVEPCNLCGGAGRVVQKQMLAPGIYQQVQMQCERCGGKGNRIKKPCKVCGGSRVVRKKSTYTLVVEKGMPREGKVVYENEGDESPDWEAGDLIVGVGEQEPQIGDADEERVDGAFMRRKGRELFWKEVLSLREAWMGGWTRNLTHLDGHVVRLGRERGQVMQPGAVEVLKEEGMPTWVNEREEYPDEDAGRLHVEYVVVLPDRMEKPMEKEFWALWEKWRRKKGVVDLGKDSGRPVEEGGKKKVKDEL